MTRQELMVQAAKTKIARIASHATLYAGSIDEIEVYEPDDMIDMFKLGAIYADEHPKQITLSAADRGVIDEIIFTLNTLGEEKMISYHKEIEFLNKIRKL